MMTRKRPATKVSPLDILVWLFSSCLLGFVAGSSVSSPHLLRTSLLLEDKIDTDGDDWVIDLPVSDINILMVTDVHSWIAGHSRHSAAALSLEEQDLHRPPSDIDYGDVLSFYQQLQRYIEQYQHKDLFFVMNGDFMDGTGLSKIPPKSLTPLLEEMPFDILNLGNHELYYNETIQWMVNHFIPHLQSAGRSYLTSNTFYYFNQTSEDRSRTTQRQPQLLQPIGSQYTYLHAPNSGKTLLAFGFVFNFESNCELTVVQRVQETVQERWFQRVLNKGGYDAILCMAHMNVTDPLVTVLKNSFRQVVGKEMPIVFVTGHTHIRAYEQLDDNTVSIESGRYLDTLGFLSFSVERNSTTSFPFQHQFIDTNLQVMSDILGMSNFATTKGLSLTDRIHETQDELGLLKTVGCTPQEYYVHEGMDSDQSLWRLYMKSIIPKYITHYKEQTTLFVQTTALFRYTLPKGEVVMDDVIAVCPFNNTLYKIAKNILGSDILKLLELPPNVTEPNSVINPGWKVPKYALSTFELDPNQQYDLLTVKWHVKDFQARLVNITGLPSIPATPLLQDPSNRKSTIWSTAELWTQYIHETWPTCRDDKAKGEEEADAIDSSSPPPEEKPMTSAIFICMIILGVYSYQRRKRYLRTRDGYESIGDHQRTSLMSTYRNSRMK